MNGWIILDKPSGITSAHAVAKVKRLLKPKKIGHAGTLDPLASGVLPLALGEATKTIPYMMDADKAYAFTVAWGEARDTDDREGSVTDISSQRPSRAEIEAILPQLIGRILQAPPAYSAIKVEGKRAYALARQGETIKLRAREVRVDRLTVDGEQRMEGDFTHFLCHCGKGTYIRSLARDMGLKLGCFGHVIHLRRIRVGKFDETHAISLEMLEEMVHKGDLGFLEPVDSALDDILAQDIDATQAARLMRGQTVVLPPLRKLTEESAGTYVLARHDGRPVAICRLAGQSMQPVRVFNL